MPEAAGVLPVQGASGGGGAPGQAQYTRVLVTEGLAYERGSPQITSVYYFDRTGRMVGEGYLGKSGEQVRWYTLDIVGNPILKQDYSGNATRYKYDYAGNVIEEIRPKGETYRYCYDVFGNVISSTDPRNHTTLFHRDAFGRVVKRVAPFNGEQTSESKTHYDGNGNLTKMVDPVGRTTEYAYDYRNRLIRVTTHPDPSTDYVFRYSYDGPKEIEHRFRLKTITRSGANRTLPRSEATPGLSVRFLRFV